MSKNLEQKIMSQIKTGKIKLRSKYIFLAEKLGLNSALVLTVILAVLFFSLVLFYIRATDNLEYLSFGKDGLLAFLESFPYLLVVSFILFLFLAGFIITKTNWSYKKPFKYFAVSLIVFVLIVGTVVAWTDISERIEEQAFGNHALGKFFRPFINRGIESRNRGMTGKIYEIDSDYLILETPRGFEKISLLKLLCPDKSINCQDQFEIGQFIIAIGKREDNIFIADKIQIASEERFPPMIRRGIHRQFSPFLNNYLFDNHSTNTLPLPLHLLNFDEPTNKCLAQCFQDKIHPRECFEKCVE